MTAEAFTEHQYADILVPELHKELCTQHTHTPGHAASIGGWGGAKFPLQQLHRS